MATNFENLIDNEPVSTPNPTPEPQPSPKPDGAVNHHIESLDYKTAREIYTEEEIRDVNAIRVTIPDPAPIVIFFGSPSSGKTMALLRMIRYFEDNEYRVVPENTFRPGTDKYFKKNCAELRDKAYSNYAPGGNDIVSFMLAKVLDRGGRTLCQILEAPGEHYFKGDPNENFPTYINQICKTRNRKVWVFFVEQDWGIDQDERNRYAQRIRNMQKNISPNDKIVFLFNKADKHSASQYNRSNKPIVKTYFNNIRNQYPGIFEKYKNSGLMSLLHGEYDFKAICFSSGIFNITNSGKEVWTLEDDWYCKQLWDAIR